MWYFGQLESPIQYTLSMPSVHFGWLWQQKIKIKEVHFPVNNLVFSQVNIFCQTLILSLSLKHLGNLEIWPTLFKRQMIILEKLVKVLFMEYLLISYGVFSLYISDRK